MTVTSGTVYVDTDYGGTESGTISEPFNTLTEGEGHFAGTCDGPCIILCRGATDDLVKATLNFDNLGNGMTVKAARDEDWSGVDDGFYGGTDLINDSFYLMKTTTADSTGIEIAEDDITVDGIQVEFSPTNDFFEAIQIQAVSDVSVFRCRVRSTTGNSIGIGADSAPGTGGTIRIDSNIVVNCSSGIKARVGNFFTPTWNIYNNTIYGCDAAGIHVQTGASSGGTVFNLKNNVIGLTATADFVETLTGGGTVNHDTNAVDDTAARTNEIDLSPGTESTDHDAAWTIPGTGRTADFHVEDASSVLADAGIQIGESKDAADVTRVSSFDVGAFNFVAVAGGRIMSSLIGSGGLVSMGGIAGIGGGLAG